MGMQALPAAVAGLAVCFSAAAVSASQIPPPCIATGAPSAEQRTAQGHAELVRSRIRQSGFTPETLRIRLAELGYHPATLDAYVNWVCGWVPVPSDSVELALMALGLADTAPNRSVQDNAPPTVTIVGEVPQPRTAVFRKDMTLSDLITDAGRLKKTADLTIEVYRTIATRPDARLAVPEIHSIRVDSAYLVGSDPRRIYAQHIPGFTYLVDRAAAFRLRPDDRVVVRRLARFRRLSRRLR